ncbi:MAG TPA: DUF952 domain-containing protein [Pseudomonadales bacterium]|nr:DUF952 domain-containing protein [Pseudomonadales bacterium]
MSRILHVAAAADLDACADLDSYAPAAFATEGFIHCCRPEQLAGVLSRYFRDRDDLQLLELDRERLGADLVDEDATGSESGSGSGSGELFPHLYARIAWSAVRSRRPLGTDANGVATS